MDFYVWILSIQPSIWQVVQMRFIASVPIEDTSPINHLGIQTKFSKPIFAWMSKMDLLLHVLPELPVLTLDNRSSQSVEI